MPDHASSCALNPTSSRTGLVRVGLTLVGGSGVLVGGLNLLFVLLVARVGGVRGFSLGSPLLSLGSVVAVIAVGPEYALMQRCIQRGIKEVTRAFLILLVTMVTLSTLAPLVALTLHTSLLLGLLGMLNAGSCLLAAPINAGFLVEDRPLACVGIGVGEALLRFPVIAVAQRNDVLALALGAGAVVNLLGGVLGLAILRFHRASSAPNVAKSAAPVFRGATNSFLALGLYLPFVIPQWMALIDLSSTSAGLLDMALVLASGVAMLPGYVTSATLPRVLRARREGMEAREDRRTGSLLVLAIVGIGVLGVLLLGPILLPMVVHLSALGLLHDLFWLLPASIGWAVLAYGIWLDSLDSVAPGLLLVWTGCLVVVLLGLSRALVIVSPFCAALVTAALWLFWRSRDGNVDERKDGERMDAELVPAPSRNDATVSGVSYGIFAYNEAALLPAAVDSALREARSIPVPVEITLVVSESDDGTEEIAQEFERRYSHVRVVHLERKGKVHAVLHFLEREARYEIAVIAGADVRPLPGSLRALLQPFDDERIGMTGPRVVPVRRRGSVPAMHRVLWEAHHQANMLGFRKLGEIVVVRRSALSFAPVAGCDEAIIEAALNQAGYERAYVPEALVENHSPSSLREYLAHRRRIHCMHLAMSCTLGQRPATMSFAVSARALLRVVRERPLLCPVAILAGFAEGLGRWMGRFDAARGKTAILWEPTASVRLEKAEVA